MPDGPVSFAELHLSSWRHLALRLVRALQHDAVLCSFSPHRLFGASKVLSDRSCRQPLRSQDVKLRQLLKRPWLAVVWSEGHGTSSAVAAIPFAFLGFVPGLPANVGL